MYVTKEKNLVSFTISEGKQYIFDINTMLLYGLQGKPLKRLPSELKNSYHTDSLVINMIQAMFRETSPMYFSNWKKPIAFCDKLSSLNYTTNVLSIYTVKKYADCIGEEMYGTKITEKIVFNFIKNGIENETSVDRETFYATLKENYFSQIATIELSNKDKDLFLRLMQYFNDKEELKLIVHWLNKGLGIYYDYNYYNIRDICLSMFTKAKYLEYKPTKDDFFKQMVMVAKNYEKRREEIDHKRLVENQTKYNLQFENEDFTVIIPTTKQEFEKEGNEQHNCVFTSYLNQVINGRTLVVFIRKKEAPNTSYITCEISNNGRICQYLGKYNERIYDTNARAFYELYQNYLTKIFNQ